MNAESDAQESEAAMQAHTRTRGARGLVAAIGPALALVLALVLAAGLSACGVQGDSAEDALNDWEAAEFWQVGDNSAPKRVLSREKDIDRFMDRLHLDRWRPTSIPADTQPAATVVFKKYPKKVCWIVCIPDQVDRSKPMETEGQMLLYPSESAVRMNVGPVRLSLSVPSGDMDALLSYLPATGRQ
ncbi:hypothetical protein KIM372_01650 [Bombiscardovia nodaiensis]|uniref:Uncharacterized protein n=1 Tax=Bombiscardovia nodaiensis TaxID=2932181 RepID=A0ABN6S9Y3_9BIFI|nr:hypothetical protein KIM372_01650 [Bombiscardovia nodaiensis]